MAQETSYAGYLNSKHWNTDSRPISEATGVLRSFVTQNIVQDNKWEIDRITKYYLYWKFYKGEHYKDFNDGLLSFNYVRAFIDKVTMFLLGDDAFTFQVKSLYSEQIDSEVEKLTEQLMMYHWARSGKEKIAYEMLQMGSITGDLWVGVNWTTSDYFDIDNQDGYCKISVFDSRQCFPKFVKGDFNKLESILIRQPLENKKAGDEILPDRHTYTLFVTKYTRENIETWYQENSKLEDEDNGIVKYEYTSIPNPYGFIPVIHIKNRPNAESYYGTSDMNDILKINKIYNELAQQLKSVIDYHVTPTTIITGASAKSLQRGLGQIWSGLPPEANVYNLGLDFDLSAATNYMAMLKTAMHELSDVPENALGRIQPISNTSAAALQITYQPLIQQAKIKAITYGEGIRRINSMIIHELMIMDSGNERLRKIMSKQKDFLHDAQIDPIFTFGFPRDRNMELQTAQMELGMNIASRRSILERLGTQNIPELLDEVDKDKFQQAVTQKTINDMLNPMPDEGGDENPDLSGGFADNDLSASQNSPQDASQQPSSDQNSTDEGQQNV